MKPIPIRVQKIIAYIPGVNLLCLAIFVYNSFCVKFTLKDYLRSWKFLVFPAILLLVFREIVIYNFPAVSAVFGNICNYLILVVVGLQLVKYQERYLL